MKSAVRMDSIQINRMTVSTYFTVRVEGSGGEDGNRALERTAWGQLAAALVPRSVSAYQCVTRNVKEFCGKTRFTPTRSGAKRNTGYGHSAPVVSS